MTFFTSFAIIIAFEVCTITGQDQLAVLIAGILSAASIELTVLKLAVVPFLYLAPIGLASIYRKPIYEHRITARGIEYSVLSALVASLSVFVLLWKPESVLRDLVELYFTIFLPFLLVMFVVMYIEKKKAEKLVK